MEWLLAVIIGAVVGLLLGILGGGGAVLIVPSMVYLLHVDEHVALATALVIVGTNALLGGFMAWREKRTDIATALIFGASGMATAYLGARLSRNIPGDMLLIAFSILLLIIATLMYRGNSNLQQAETARPRWHIIGVGAIVGLVTGTLGVGGGFLIVPAMVLLVGMPMRQAVGTSLIVIAINSAASLLGHLDTPFDWSLIALLLLGALPSIALSGSIAKRISQEQLRRGFAIFITIIAVLMLAENIYGRLAS